MTDRHHFEHIGGQYECNQMGVVVAETTLQ